jgi:hypothetical protein
MVTDGFETTDPEYLAATALLSADTKVDSFMVGKGALPPTQVWTISVKTVTAGAEYNLRVGADSISVTAGSGTFAGNDTIVTQLNAAIQAATGYAASGFTSAVTGSVASKKVTITASTAGNYLAIEPEDIDLIDVVEAEADPGIATDLAAIAAYDNTWYGLVTCFKSKAIVQAAAAWVETAEKLYLVASNESAVANTVLAGATDVAAALKTSAYARTGVIYHPANDQFADAGWLGKCLPYDPGEETWAYKTLAGVDAVSLTPTHRTNILAKYATCYETVAGVNATQFGTVAANEYIDVVRFRDWLKARIKERSYARLVNSKKVPFTDAGIAVIEAEVRGQLDEGIQVGGIAADPEPTVTVPKASAVSTADKTARLLKNVEFTATLAGAIHKLEISGVISV